MIQRRQFLKFTTGGFATISAASALSPLVTLGSQTSGPHHEAKAKRVIFLFMHGGPSQVDLFDYKPLLKLRDGKQLPFEPARNIDARPKLMASPWKFAKHGESDQYVSELMPHLAKEVDRLCFIKSMHSRGQSHGQAVSMLHTGTDNLVRPSVGAWISFGLGGGNPDLPAFISISPSTGHGGPRNYGSAFLPSIHQATTVGRNGKLGDAKIRDLQSGNKERQQHQLELLESLNAEHLKRTGGDQQVQGVIDSFDLANRMQSEMPGVLKWEDETAETQSLYGIGEKETDNFGKQCLLARRFAEAGVRYIQVSTGNVWDQHGDLKNGHTKNSKMTDKPVAGLLADLARRGLLEDTLVVWGGEFGRTPIVQGTNGRDHNPQGFTMWLAGGGSKPGMSHGETDEYGYYAVKDRVHMHDLHATMLHLLGLDHTKLTYKYAGRDFRLTDVYGKVVHEVIA